MNNNDFITRNDIREEINRLHTYQSSIGEHMAAVDDVLAAINKCPNAFANDSRESPVEIIHDALKTLEGLNAALDAQAVMELRLHKHTFMTVMTELETDLQTALRLMRVPAIRVEMEEE